MIPKLYSIIVNKYLCDGCNDCYAACPINASLNMKAQLSGSTAVIRIINGKAEQGVDGCDGCGVCIEICHKKAITLKLR